MDNAIRKIKSAWRIFYKTSLLHKVFYFLAFLISISLITNYGYSNGYGTIEEGFEKATKNFNVNADVTQIYDDFYVNIYDDLVFSEVKNKFEIGKLIEYTKPIKNTRILDVGSGTGHHVNSFVAQGYNCEGIDISPSMVNKAKQSYPELRFTAADVLDVMLYPADSFNYITCFYFTLYYIKDKRTFFENSMKWLMPGGYLAVHLVNRDKFDPIIPAGNPFVIVSPQKFAKKRIMSTTVKFNSLEYKSKFDMKDNIDGLDSPNAIMNETIKTLTTGDVRKNEHKLYMPTQAEILDIAKSAGFIIHSKIDLLKCQYESQYVYVLQKPT
jgi:ubiquinone/menaquinone biosynthesis C-methylase UbiE